MRRRTTAHTLCQAGRVRLNGSAAKPSTSVKPGDVITITRGDRRLVAKVVTVPERPSPAQDLVEILGRINMDEVRASGLGPSQAHGQRAPEEQKLR